MFAVSPPESIACTTTGWSPAEANECSAVFVVDHDVSHVSSPVQSQRTWIALGGSRSSLTCAVNVNTVLASPDVGVQTKSAVGGAFGGSSGPTRRYSVTLVALVRGCSKATKPTPADVVAKDAF